MDRILKPVIIIVLAIYMFTAFSCNNDAGGEGDDIDSTQVEPDGSVTGGTPASGNTGENFHATEATDKDRRDYRETNGDYRETSSGVVYDANGKPVNRNAVDPVNGGRKKISSHDSALKEQGTIQEHY